MARLPDLQGASAAAVTGFCWGLAEATVFFIVPDVLLCFWAMKSAKGALAATLASVFGSMCGAVLLYLYLNHDAARYTFLHGVWGCLPGYRAKMAETAAEHLRIRGAAGLISGPGSGIPYRVYVLEAWKSGLPLGDILLWSPIARLERIVIAPVAVLALRFVAERWLAPRFRQVRWNWLLAVLIVIYWIALYAWYWGSLVPQLYGQR